MYCRPKFLGLKDHPRSYFVVLYSTKAICITHTYIIINILPREATRSAVLPRQVVRLSVCLSVTLRYRDHIRWNFAKITSRLISLTISLSADPNMTDLLQSQHPQILAGIGVG